MSSPLRPTLAAGGMHQERRRRAVALVVAMLVLATSCAAFAEDDATSTRDDVERENREEGDVEGAVGDELEVYDLTVQVTEVERVAQFSELDSRGYIVATVSMTNDTGRSIDYDRTDWRLEKPDGSLSNTANVSGEAQLRDDKIPAGGTVEGRVIFTAGDLDGQFAIVFVSASMRPSDGLQLERGVWIFDSSPEDAG